MKEFYVDTPEQLDELCERLRGAASLALDTEFLRERTFYAQLCLLQIASEEVVACVDPLALPTLAPLLEIIYDERVLKIMHAGRQDLEILFDLRGMLGFTVDVAWEEIKFSREHPFDFRKIAIVSSGQWISWSTWIQRLFTDAKLQSFDDYDVAHNWVCMD